MIPDSPFVSRRARFAACALLLLAGWAVFFWSILVDGRVPVFRDILETTVPLGQYIGTRLREGRLPQWFPYEGLGEPFIGQLNESTFHPASWLYALLPVATALRWELVLGYLVAASGQLLLARKLGFSLTGAALAAVIFAFSGYPVALGNVISYLWGFASLPWLGLLAAEVFLQERPWPWMGALALCWASIVVAGDSHSAVFGGLVVLFVGAMTGRLRRLPLCILASLLAIGVAAAELVPAIDIVRAGPRASWFNAGKIASLSKFWALHPYRLPELLFPGWMPVKSLVLFSNARYDEGGVWALSIFAGVPVLALATAGLLSRTRRGLLPGLLALFALWLALGSHAGLEPVLRRLLPILNVLRYPEKNLAVWTFGVSLAAAAGLDSLRGSRRLVLPAVLLVLAACCAAAAIVLPEDAPLRIWPQLAQVPQHVPSLYAAWHGALLATAASLAGIGVVLAAASRRPAAIAGVPIAVFLELWTATGAVIATGAPSVVTDTPRFCAAALKAGAGPSGLRVIDASSRDRSLNEMETPETWAAMTRNLLQPDTSAMCGIGTVWIWPILSNEPRLFRRMVGRSHLELNPTLRLFGFGLLVRAHPEDAPTPDETAIDALELGGKAIVLGKRPAAPRAYAATPRWVPDLAAAIREVEQHPASVAASPVLIGAGPQASGEGPVGTVRIESYQPEHVVLEAQMARAGAVILNDLYANGWTASLDGAAAQIFAANVLVRGVLVPPGAHRIEMSYALPGLRLGLGISGVSLALCAALVVLGALRPRGPASEEQLQRR